MCWKLDFNELWIGLLRKKRAWWFVSDKLRLESLINRDEILRHVSTFDIAQEFSAFFASSTITLSEEIYAHIIEGRDKDALDFLRITVNKKKKLRVKLVASLTATGGERKSLNCNLDKSNGTFRNVRSFYWSQAKGFAESFFPFHLWYRKALRMNDYEMLWCDKKDCHLPQPWHISEKALPWPEIIYL